MKLNKKIFIIFSIIGLVLFFIAFFVKKPYNAENTEKVFQYLSDCAIIPGVVLILIYSLTWVASEGMFDGLSYAGRFLASMFVPNTRLYDKNGDYRSYKEEKLKNRKEKLDKESLIVGLIFFVIAIIFYIFYLIF